MTQEYAVRLRGLRWLFGYYDSEATALQALAQMEPDGYAGVWRGLNPLRPESALLATVNAPMHASKHRAGAEDIAHRATLLLDFDAECASDVMSTDVEHRDAISQSEQCSRWLVSSHGWARPKQIDSGRGCQLHVAVSLPADSSMDALVKNLLRSLKSRYPLMDAAMHDRPRLARLPGFWNRKSVAPTAERPHRMAKLLNAGDSGLVTRQQIEAVIALIGLPAPSQYTGTETPDPARVERTVRRLADFLDRIGVALTEIVPLSDGRTLLRVSHCPLNPAHTGSSAGIGISVSGRPLRMCCHTSCAMPWSEWRAAVEREHGVPMNLGDRLIFSAKRGTN